MWYTPDMPKDSLATNVKVTVTQEIPISRVANLLCSALEGGSNYWAEIVKFTPPTSETFTENKDFRHLHYPLNPGGSLTILDSEEGKKHKLDLSAIEKGLQKMADSEYNWHFGNFMAENDDAETGDVFLQFCLFGEIVYG